MTQFIANQQQTLLNGQCCKEDTNMYRSNEVCTASCARPCTMHNAGATIIEKDVRITEERIGGSPMHMHGSPAHIHGSPSRMQGSPRLIQGSPTGLVQGSPCRNTGYNQSLGQTIQQTNFVQNQSLGHIHQNQHIHQDQHMITNQTQHEIIYEKPVVIEHNEASVVKSVYEGHQHVRVDEADVRQSHTMAPMVKEIHQDVIHQHHKDVLVEHKRDVVHEHHQNIIHEHNQPIVYEKHIHEHHQPIIHEKHTTLVEERHVPIVRETHLESTNVQNSEVVDEVYDAAVVTESFSQPIVHTTQAQTIVETDRMSGVSQGHIHNHGHVHTTGLNQGHMHGGQTIVEETVTTTDRHMGNTGYVQEGFVQESYGQDAYLGDNRTYVNEVDEFGRPRKAGFFQNLKTKMGGRKNKEAKIL